MRSLVPAVLGLAFTVYCVVDVVRSEPDGVRGLPKTMWVVLCLVFPVAGGIAWLVAGRPRTPLPGLPRPGRARPTVTGPDDDPDFLRTIDRPRPVPPARPLAPGAGTTPPPSTGDRLRKDAPGSDDDAAGPPPADGAPQEPDDGDAGPGTPAGTDDRRP